MSFIEVETRELKKVLINTMWIELVMPLSYGGCEILMSFWAQAGSYQDSFQTDMSYQYVVDLIRKAERKQ